LERAVALAPGNGLTHYLLARARFRAADRAGAKDALEAAVRLRPDYENAWRLLGLMRFEDGRFDAAQKALSRAARLVPDGETYWAIARCFVAMRDFAEAMVALEEAVRLKPNHTVAHRALAMLGRYRGESDVEHRHLLQLFVLDEGMARELEKEFNGESPDGT
jgi:cytochrome c-type biogenesis protein CcmH/NrfG